MRLCGGDFRLMGRRFCQHEQRKIAAVTANHGINQDDLARLTSVALEKSRRIREILDVSAAAVCSGWSGRD